MKYKKIFISGIVLSLLAILSLSIYNTFLVKRNIRLKTENEELGISMAFLESDNMAKESRIDILEDEITEQNREHPEEYNLRPTGKVSTCNNKEILAKLLYLEAGNMDWKGQVYTCSAILNLSDYLRQPLSVIGKDPALFTTAVSLDGAHPTEKQYEVIDYVLKGGRIPTICYFRTGHYHNFGIPVCKVGAHYFSKPEVGLNGKYIYD